MTLSVCICKTIISGNSWVVQWLGRGAFYCHGPISSLVRELRSCKPRWTARNKSNMHKSKTKHPPPQVHDIPRTKEMFPTLLPLPLPRDMLSQRISPVGGSGSWMEGQEGVPTHNALMRCDHQRQVRYVLPEHSFSGDHSKRPSPETCSPSAFPVSANETPSNQFPKLDSVADSPSPI